MNRAIQGFLIQASKILLKMAADKALKSAMPEIYEKLNFSIPVALFNRSSSQLIELEIRHVIESLTRRTAAQSEVELIAALYNPIKNAQHTRRAIK